MDHQFAYLHVESSSKLKTAQKEKTRNNLVPDGSVKFATIFAPGRTSPCAPKPALGIELVGYLCALIPKPRLEERQQKSLCLVDLPH